jgi:hypothetical protein
MQTHLGEHYSLLPLPTMFRAGFAPGLVLRFSLTGNRVRIGSVF